MLLSISIKHLHYFDTYNVQKRDGNTEPFDQEKMARAVSRAGTPFVMALDIAKTIKTNKDLIQKNT
jgi:hypothetical protein